MKKALWFRLAVVALIIPVVSFAAEFRAGEQPSVRVGENIVNDVYIAGGNVTSAGNVVGDVIAAGGDVLVSGTVEGDIVAAGGNVTILGNVNDDIRVGGGSVLLQGRVEGDVIVGGGQVTIGGPGVGGDVVVGGGNIRIDAPINGSLRAGGGNVYINSPVAGNLTINAEKVTLGSAAIISGNISYKATRELIKENGAVVQGKIRFEPRPEMSVPATIAAGLISLWVIGKFLALLACALVIGLMFRRYSKEAISKAMTRPLYELGRGLVVIILFPVISVLMFITVVGIPFGVIGLIGFIALMLFSWIVTPIIVGGIIHNYFYKRGFEVTWKTITLGVFAFQVVGVVPVLGALVKAFSMLVTLGVIASIKLEVARQWR